MTPYFNISLRITIADKYQFYVAESIHIENSTEKISDTAKVTLPREFKQVRQDDQNTSLAGERLLDFIKVGDKIKIELGYDGDLQSEFEGYITKVGAEIPIELECEDEMYQLKKMKPVNKLFKNVALKEVVQFLAPGYNVNCKYEVKTGKIAFDNVTPYNALLDLKNKGYPFRFFFRDKTLMVHMNIDPDIQQQHQFNLNRNVRKGGDLKYETKEDRKFWIKAVSKQVGTSKEVTYEFGDKGESERKLDCPSGLNKNELKIWAENYYKKLNYDGYGGGFDSWCYPRTKAGDSANLTDPNYPNKHRDGVYYINEVTIDVNQSEGIKRNNKLTFKIK
ncbi:MAG: hypothetical protein WCJ72_06490 [Chryseobacterium sp.]